MATCVAVKERIPGGGSSLVLTTESLIADKPEPKKEAPAMPGGGMGGYDMM